MIEEKPKNYYSLNLTEGRIFIIFICILILITIIAFGIAYLISNHKTKTNQIDLLVENESNSNLEDNNFSFYRDLNDESNITPFIDNQENNTGIESNNENTNNQRDFKIEVHEKNNTQEIKNDSGIVKIDNSEKIYSSNYIKESLFPKKIDKNKPKIVNTEKKTINRKRYIIQIGSYINKKTAEDMSIYYKMQGYPAYIKSKQNNGKIYYRLRVGPFKEKNKAEEYLASLKKSKYGKKSYVSIIFLTT